MNFELSKPQQLLRETTRASLSKACPTKRVRELMLTDTAFDADLWQTITDQGWATLHLPEQSGGLGLGLVELAVVPRKQVAPVCPDRSCRPCGRPRFYRVLAIMR